MNERANHNPVPRVFALASWAWEGCVKLQNRLKMYDVMGISPIRQT